MSVFLNTLAEWQKTAPQNIPDWLARFRASSWQKVESAGLPSTRHESWRFTSLRPLAGLAPIATENAPWEFIDDFNGNQLHQILDPRGLNLVLVDGVFAAELSGTGPDVRNTDNLNAVVIEDLAAIIRGRDDHAARMQTSVRSILDDVVSNRQKLPVPLAAVAPQESTPRNLTNAFLTHGILIQIAPDADVTTPIRIIHVRSGKANTDFSHSLVSIGKNSKASLTEVFIDLTRIDLNSIDVNHKKQATAPGGNECSSAHFRQTVITMAAASTLDHKRISAIPKGIVLGATDATVPENAVYNSLAINLPTRISRHDLTAMITGSGASVTLNGLSACLGEDVLDTHSAIDHRVPDTTSHQLYKSVLKDKSRSVFSGRIFVRKDAQRTAAFQQSRNLLISPDAEVDTKPQLEIEADDVKCSHGATVAQLNPAELFYLRSRGIPKETAEAMLCDAFAAEIWRGTQDTWFESLCARLLEETFQ